MANIAEVKQTTLTNLVLADLTTAVNAALAVIAKDDILKMNWDVAFDGDLGNFVYSCQIVSKLRNDTGGTAAGPIELVTVAFEGTNLAAFNTAVNTALAVCPLNQLYTVNYATAWEDVTNFTLYTCQIVRFQYNQ